VLGKAGLGPLYAGIHAMKTAGYATDHDALVAKKLAYVMCGGELSEPKLMNNIYWNWSVKHFFHYGERNIELIQSVLTTVSSVIRKKKRALA
jgi:3-hydroxyacyl-CoA dehydrogenase